MKVEQGSAELAKIQNGFRSLDDIQWVLKSLEKLTNWSERSKYKKYVAAFWFELMWSIPIFGPISMPTEILFNIYHCWKQYGNARRLGMSSRSISKIIINHFKDSIRDIPISWLWLLFAIWDMKFMANTKNAQEFLKFYGQEIENLKKMGATVDELKSYQKEFDRLKIEFEIWLEKVENIKKLASSIESAKNLNELKSIIMEKLPSELKNIDVWNGLKVTLTKKQIRSTIDAYLSWQTDQLRNIPKAYWLQDAVKRLTVSKSSQTIPTT